MKRLVGIPAFAPALALLALSACTPDVPASPTYTKDVQPILAAHCVRCHGANGTLNGDPKIHTPLAVPMICYLQSYDNNPVGCTTETTCQHGAAYCASGGLITQYINFPVDSSTRMPPSPSDPLNDWEKEVLTRWANEKPPAQ
jgi:hypothetical protein